jgi:hypothetical protein
MTALEDFLPPRPETAAFETPSGTATLTVSNAAALENVERGTIVGRLSASGLDLRESDRFELLDDAEGPIKIVDEALTVRYGSLIDDKTDAGHEIVVWATDAGRLGGEDALHRGRRQVEQVMRGRSAARSP